MHSFDARTDGHGHTDTDTHDVLIEMLFRNTLFGSRGVYK